MYSTTLKANILEKKAVKICLHSLVFLFLLTILSAKGWGQKCDKKSDQALLSKNMTDLIWNNDYEQIRKIINDNPELVNIRLQNEETLLTAAAWQGNLDFAKYLIDQDINVNMRNYWDNTALHNASIQGYSEMALLLLEKGANVQSRGTNGNTALFFAAQNENSGLVRLLLQQGANPNSENDYEQTPLIAASWNGNPEVVKMLVNNGAEVNQITPSGNSVLHNLAANGNIESMQMVLDKGANANVVNDESYLPLHNAVINQHPEAVFMLLKHTDQIGKQEVHFGNTPLHIAALNGDQKSVAILIEAGADASIKNFSGETALDYAIKYGNTDVVDYFVEKKLAQKSDRIKAETNRENALVSLPSEEAKLVYCGHSGWCIQTANHVLIFDYWKPVETGQPAIANGNIDPKELYDKDVIVFVSHDHTDHYDTCIYSWADQIKNIRYVYGFRPEESWIHREKGYHGPDYIYIEDHQEKDINGAKITAFKSTDTGQGFLVEVDGLTIYHPGDHAWFSAQDELPFKKEVDFIAENISSVDIAFFPVTGCPSRWKKEFILAGFEYSLEKLHPSHVFPMHSFNREYTMKEFAEYAEKIQSESQVLCSENPGDNFFYNKAVVASNE